MLDSVYHMTLKYTGQNMIKVVDITLHVALIKDIYRKKFYCSQYIHVNEVFFF